MGGQNELMPNEATVKATTASVDNSKFASKTLQDYEVISVIGNGCFGTCYKVRDKATGQLYAWKGMDFDEELGASKEALTQEINVLRQLQHPNIVQYYHHLINYEAKSIFIVMECCEGGDLAQLIAKARAERKRFEERYVWRVLFQLCKALQLCHTKLREGTVLHRDIKPANIFLDTAGNAKLGDFGLARMLRRNEEHFAQTIVGTPYYMSPEIVGGAKYDRKSDVWALGCLMYELCKLVPPFRGRDCVQLSVSITQGKFSHLPAAYSADLKDIIAFMLAVDTEERPGIEIITRHPLVVRNINDLGNEFPQLVDAESDFFIEGGEARCKLQYSIMADLSSTRCSEFDYDDVTVLGGRGQLSVSGVFTPDLRTELFYSAKRRVLAKTSAMLKSDPELYESLRNEQDKIVHSNAATPEEPAQLTQNIFDRALQDRLHFIRAQESVLEQRALDLDGRAEQLNEWERRLQALEEGLLKRERNLDDKAKAAPTAPASRPQPLPPIIAPPPPVPPRKPTKHDDTYCSIESNDSIMRQPTVAKLDLAALPPVAKAFPTLRKVVTFQQSPKKFITYDIENRPPGRSRVAHTPSRINRMQASSVSSKGSDDSNEGTSTRRRKSIFSSIFGLHRSHAKDVPAKAAPLPTCRVAKEPPLQPFQPKADHVLAKCETTDLSNIWTKEHKRAAFDLLAAMNAGDTIVGGGVTARHKTRQSMRERNLQRTRLRRSLVLPPPQPMATTRLASSEREHMLV